MSYLLHAFLGSPEPPSAADARAYLLEGVLFDEKPSIKFQVSSSGAFQTMSVRYGPDPQVMTLRRLSGEESEAARGEAVDEAALWGDAGVAGHLAGAPTILEWEIERTAMTEDSWFALHLWQAWVLRPGGWLYAPDDGIFDASLRRLCGPRKVS